MAVEKLILGTIILSLFMAGALFYWRTLTPKLGWQERAGFILASYAERLRVCAEEIEQPHADVFWDMAEHLERIRVEVMSDQRDLIIARRFIYHHAKLIVELVEKFCALHSKVRAEHTSRLEQMVTQLHGYRDVFIRLENACIGNDFEDIEATMEALDLQLERLTF